MPSFFHRISPKVKKDYETVDSSIINIINLIRQSTDNEQSKELIAQIKKRQRTFKKLMQNTNSEKQLINLIYFYFCFSLLISSCINHPHEIQQHIQNYYNSPYYLSIGGSEGQFSETAYDDAAFIFMIVGLGLFLAGVTAISLSFPGALVILGLAAIPLIPSVFYLFAETSPNRELVKKEENALFGAAINFAQANFEGYKDGSANEPLEEETHQSLFTIAKF